MVSELRFLINLFKDTGIHNVIQISYFNLSSKTRIISVGFGEYWKMWENMAADKAKLR